MTLQQGVAFAIVGVMMVLLAWGRLRYDVVAMMALFAAVLTGIVPAKEAFSGFGDDLVIIVASALMISAAIARSGVVEVALAPIGPYLSGIRGQILVLSLTVGILSAISKNVGALAIMLPVAVQLAHRTGTSTSQLLMPMAFASLLGGLMTMIGSSPNIIVSRVRQEIGGAPFGMLDYAPVGVPVAMLGIAYLAFAWRLLPADRKGASDLGAAINIENYVAELRVPEASRMVGRRAREVEALGQGAVKITVVVRERFRRYRPTRALLLQAGDVLLLEGEPDAIERVMVQAELELPGKSRSTAQDRDDATGDPEKDEIGVVEGVVQGDSRLIGSSVAELDLARRHRVTMLAVSRSGERIVQRLRSVRLRAGDVVVLQGRLDAMPDVLAELGVLPLAARELALGLSRQRWLPVTVLLLAMTAAAMSLVPVAVAFFGAVLALLLLRAIPLREAYDSIEWPTIVLLGALIPVSEAIRTTGGTDLVAAWLQAAVHAVPATFALALIMVVAMAATPFLNNAATVLVMAPIGVSLAQRLGLAPEPFLMAVAVGASCDFLTPFGHQCNTLVMGPGGYRFGDYWKLGLPLSIMVIVVGVPLIALVWPLAAH